MCISIPFYSTYISASDVKSAHTHTHVTVSFWGVMYFGLRGEGRRNWQIKVWNEYELYVCIEILESSFLRQIFYL